MYLPIKRVTSLLSLSVFMAITFLFTAPIHLLWNQLKVLLKKLKKT
jgi:hypothetical protein